MDTTAHHDGSSELLIAEVMVALALADVAGDETCGMLRDTSLASTDLEVLTEQYMHGAQLPPYQELLEAIDRLADETMLILEDDLGGATVTLFLTKLEIASYAVGRAWDAASRT